MPQQRSYGQEQRLSEIRTAAEQITETSRVANQLANWYTPAPVLYLFLESQLSTVPVPGPTHTPGIAPSKPLLGNWGGTRIDLVG